MNSFCGVFYLFYFICRNLLELVELQTQHSSFKLPPLKTCVITVIALLILMHVKQRGPYSRASADLDQEKTCDIIKKHLGPNPPNGCGNLEKNTNY